MNAEMPLEMTVRAQEYRRPNMAWQWHLEQYRGGAWVKIEVISTELPCTRFTPSWWFSRKCMFCGNSRHDHGVIK